MDYHEWTIEMDYPKSPALKKRDYQSLVLLIDGLLPLPSSFFNFFLFYAVGQLLYTRIHWPGVMADTLCGE